MNPPLDDDSDEARDARFEALFGVTRQDLTRQGIDADEYAAQNIHQALKDRSNWWIIPKSGQMRRTQLKWAWRGYVAMFVGLGFLALSKSSQLHWLGLVGAWAALLVAVVTYAVMLKYRRRYLESCKQEGVVPRRWRGNSEN